jgi:hypothetical protein
MNREEAQSTIVQALIEALRNRARNGFELSQIACPVVTMTLKNSGSIEDIPNGSMLSYKAPYASIVERGIEDHIETIPGYSRKGRMVHSHTRRVHAKEGLHFIETSLKKAFETLSNSVDGELRVKFARVERR